MIFCLLFKGIQARKRTIRNKKNHEMNVMELLELPSLDMSLLEMFLQGHPCYQGEKKS